MPIPSRRVSSLARVAILVFHQRKIQYAQNLNVLLVRRDGCLSPNFSIILVKFATVVTLVSHHLQNIALNLMQINVLNASRVIRLSNKHTRNSV